MLRKNPFDFFATSENKQQIKENLNTNFIDKKL